MAHRLKLLIFVSQGGQDEVCPPMNFYATYNRIQSRKKIIIYPFNGHEGGTTYHTEKGMTYIKNL